jgi:hypothetical protein
VSLRDAAASYEELARLTGELAAALRGRADVDLEAFGRHRDLLLSRAVALEPVTAVERRRAAAALRRALEADRQLAATIEACLVETRRALEATRLTRRGLISYRGPAADGPSRVDRRD